MDASYAQTSFLGGELSKWAQGQFDKPEYKISLAKASNILIVDEGAAPRRPGFQFLGTTRNGAPGRLLPFDFSEDAPYNLEFTDNFLRMWNGNSLVTTNDSQIVATISNGTPAVFTLPAAVTWKTGEEVYFSFNNPAEAVEGAVLLNRQFILTMLTSTTFTVADSVTGTVINASMLNAGGIVGTFTFDGPMGSAPVSDNAISASPTTRTLLQNLSPTVNHISQMLHRMR